MAELRVKRALAASPERVWNAFTTEQLAAWMWPASWQTVSEVDLRVGGRYRIASPVAKIAVSGEFVVIEPTSRLVQTWRWDGEELETLVTVALEPAGAGTLLTIVHERFDSAENRDNHVQGWNDCLDRLAPLLAA